MPGSYEVTAHLGLRYSGAILNTSRQISLKAYPPVRTRVRHESRWPAYIIAVRPSAAGTLPHVRHRRVFHQRPRRDLLRLKANRLSHTQTMPFPLAYDSAPYRNRPDLGLAWLRNQTWACSFIRSDSESGAFILAEQAHYGTAVVLETDLSNDGTAVGMPSVPEAGRSNELTAHLKCWKASHCMPKVMVLKSCHFSPGWRI